MKLENRILGAALAGLVSFGLGACASTTQDAPAPAARSIGNGPSADYPIVIGDLFTIDGVTYTPLDTMNYDQVGYVTVDESGTKGITGAHRTLPLPSYIEVTALDTGRTILVRLERRGPMTNERLLALSADALGQLGADEGAPIRVRRVNPPEEHRAELRAGREAPLRMDTPQGLLEVLKRRLPERGSASLGDSRQAQVSGAMPAPDIATVDPDEEAAMPSPPQEIDTDDDAQPAAESEVLRPELPMAVDGGPTPAPVMVETAEDGKFAVQLGAFSVRSNADGLARRVQGYLETSGNLTLVRVGPFATRGQAEQALAMLRERGYSDAEIRLLD